MSISTNVAVDSFNQTRVICKIHFITQYQYLELLENFVVEATPGEDDVLGISTYEMESSTIEAQPSDLWSFEVYLGVELNIDIFKKELLNFADLNKVKITSDITIEKLQDKDWVTEYQKQQKPIEIGKFFITSSEQNVQCSEEKTPIFIEASRAFGTGDHATTSLCIQAMESLDCNFQNIFDIGSGTGILAFAAEKIWPKAQILACDIDKIAVEIAQDNKAINKSNIDFYQNSENSLDIPDIWNKKFDLIISNILAQPLISLATDLKLITHKNSKIILSGFLDYQQEEVESAYHQLQFKTIDVLQQNQWVSLILSR